MDVRKEYSTTKKVATYEVGENSKLKLSSLLKICQDVSEQHLGELELPYERLKNDGFVFLFMKTGIKINKMPEHREEIKILTRPCGTVTAQFYREFLISSLKTKELLLHVLQSSVLVDVSAHKIQRPKIFEKYGIDVGKNNGNKLDKIIMPSEMELMGERTVTYTDLDYNGHLNNAVYGDILCDFIPGGLFGRRFSGVQINYLGECVFNDRIKIYATVKDGIVYLYGENERGRSFECKLIIP